MNREELQFQTSHPWRDRAIEAGLALAVAGVLFGIAAGPAFGQEAVVTAPRTDVIAEMRIPYAKASLNEQSYVKGLRGEIRRASRQVCPWLEFNDDLTGASQNSCIQIARDDGYRQLDAALAQGYSMADRGSGVILLVARR